jgi:hypothetical protein
MVPGREMTLSRELSKWICDRKGLKKDGRKGGLINEVRSGGQIWIWLSKFIYWVMGIQGLTILPKLILNSWARVILLPLPSGYLGLWEYNTAPSSKAIFMTRVTVMSGSWRSAISSLQVLAEFAVSVPNFSGYNCCPGPCREGLLNAFFCFYS